jgi:phenylpropionate dioxygenase-like ring-hydroxylating dioxygenase large terminal subunit
MFLRNHWYVGALARDLGREPLQSWMLGEPVVLFRKQNGEPVALRDRCPHRHAPLSMGKLIGDEIQCRYHGMQFDGAGLCTRIPGEVAIPAALRVASFPVMERYGLVWVWMGTGTPADEARLPEWPWHDQAGFLSYFGGFEIEVPFQMIIDNLMDLTHVHFVHRILGAGNLIHESEPMEVRQQDDRVFFRREMKKGQAEEEGAYFEVAGRYLPPSVVVTSAVPRLAGSPEIQPGPVSQVLHCLTPRDESRTRYFVLKCWNVLTRPHEVTAMNYQNDVTIAEDKEIIEAQWRIKQAFDQRDEEMLIRADRAAVLSRRLHEKLLRHESDTGG